MTGVVEHATGIGPAVVVGMDGLEHGSGALLFAAEEARLRDLPLVVLQSWHITSVPRPSDAESGYIPSLEEFEAVALEQLRDQVGQVLGESAEIDVRLLPVHSHAVDALVEASTEATLVVVGSRGRGEIAGLVLGSVSEKVLHRAHCPVVVVR